MTSSPNRRCRRPYLGYIAPLAAVAAIAGPLSPAHAQHYTFTTFDEPNADPTDQGTLAYKLNNANELVGTYGDSGGVHGFSDNGGTFQTIDVTGAVGQTEALGVNDAGLIVGTYVDASGVVHGFLDSAGTFTTIDATNPESNPDTDAYGINKSGEIVGYTSGAADTEAFTDIGGVFTSFEDPVVGTIGTSATDIDNNGDIVGAYADSADTAHGFLDVGGAFTTIDDPLAGTGFGQGTYVYSINDSGEMVGVYMTATGGGGYVDIGGVFTSINVPGALVTVVTGVNDAGDISGAYSDASGTHGFFGTPTAAPEPGALALSCMGLLVPAERLVRRRMRRVSAAA